MMMTHQYYGGNDFDAFHRPAQHRTMPNGSSYYDRAGPYSTYYEPRPELRQEYGGRVPMHAMINEPEQPDVAGGPPRRRIAVACARCRRRKIKCSGDPGDGSGCHACKSSGANTQDCNFTRVMSYTLPMKATSMDMLPSVSTSNAPVLSTHFGMEPSSAASSSFSPATYPGHHPPSLPTLHTPSSYATNDYDQPYDNSPLEVYTYNPTTIPRQDSYASSYGSQDSYRSFSAAPLSAPATAPFYEQQHGTYSFGTLQSPAPGRLPSVKTDTLSSSLNMDSLHSTLPLNTPTERRLPAPYTISYPQHNWSSQLQPQPELRPFDTPNFRPHINGIHSRNAMAWTPDSGATRSSSMALQQSVLPPPQQQQQHLHLPTTSYPSSSGVDPNPASTTASQSFGYQFQHSAPPPYSPDISPTSAPDTYPSNTSTSGSLVLPSIPATTMLPPPSNTLRYTASNPPLAEQHYSSTPLLSSNPTVRHREAAASLYSFSSSSSSAAAGNSTDLPQTQTSHPHQAQTSQPQQQLHASQSQQQISQQGQSQSPSQGQQQQRPHHAASHEGLRRVSSGFDLQQQSGVSRRGSARSLRER